MMSFQLGTFCKELGIKIISHSTLKTILSLIGGFFAYFIGLQSYAGIEVLTLLCAIDIFAAFIVLHQTRKSINSRKLPKKALDLFVYVILIGVVNLLSKTSVLFGTFLVDSMIVWFSATEALSILEHASELGYKVPWSILTDLKKITKE